jgi:hypothetical protein
LLARPWEQPPKQPLQKRLAQRRKALKNSKGLAHLIPHGASPENVARNTTPGGRQKTNRKWKVTFTANRKISLAGKPYCLPGSTRNNQGLSNPPPEAREEPQAVIDRNARSPRAGEPDRSYPMHGAANVRACREALQRWQADPPEAEGYTPPLQPRKRLNITLLFNYSRGRGFK